MEFAKGVWYSCIITPHAQRERGKVIGVGVLIYIYVYITEKVLTSKWKKEM